MNNIMARDLFRLILATALFVVSAGAQADTGEGVTAYNKGDYQAAFNKLRPLAIKGDAMAQLYLGRMYMQGLGLKLDYNKAISWTSRAAAQKNVEAQYFLGFLYQYGLGAPQNYKEAM